jgi:putative PIN family toxin of toxin-antitoxin system
VKVILDTNILLAIAPQPSAYHWVFQALRMGDFSLVVSTDMLDEYAEKLGEWYGEAFTDAVLNELTSLPNVLTTSPSYFYPLITADPDDNKFTDAYLSGNANLLVSNDGHFKALFAHRFPAVNWMLFADFADFLRGKPLVLQKLGRKKKQ